jgi:hypothetical protein
MADIKRYLGTRTAVPSLTLNSLANDTYVGSGAIDLEASDPIDVVVEVSVTPGTVSSDKALLVFVQVALDGGTNYSTGPTSGTSATDEANLYLVGVLPLATNSAAQRGAWSLFAALGFVPSDFKVVVRNRSGAALAGSGNDAYYTPVFGSV